MKYLKYLLLVIVILPALFFLNGLITPVVSYECRIITDAPIDTAWNVFTDDANMGEWVSGFKSIKRVEGQQDSVGSVYEMTVENGGETFVMEETLTAFDERKQFAFDLDNDVMLTSVDIRFGPDFEGTEMFAKHEIRGKNLVWRSLFPLMKSQFAEQSQKDYDKLKLLMNKAVADL